MNKFGIFPSMTKQVATVFRVAKYAQGVSSLIIVKRELALQVTNSYVQLSPIDTFPWHHVLLKQAMVSNGKTNTHFSTTKVSFILQKNQWTMVVIVTSQNVHTPSTLATLCGNIISLTSIVAIATIFSKDWNLTAVMVNTQWYEFSYVGMAHLKVETGM